MNRLKSAIKTSSLTR